VETTALLLEDQLAIDPKDPIVSQLAEFLVRKRSGRWWNTTRGTAAVVAALARYTSATGEADASYSARLSLNGRELERYAVDKGKVTGVRTASGSCVGTPMVVNAAGPYAAQVAAWAGVDLPVKPVRRHCFTTEPLPMARENLPMIVDMASGVYMHRESGGMLLGYANPEEPEGFNLSVNWDLLERIVEPAMHRVPALEAAQISNGWAGLYETTPDHNSVLGPPQAVQGLMLANGFSGHGFMHAPAVGRLITEWIVDGKPSLDLTPLRLERFSEHRDMVEANVI